MCVYVFYLFRIERNNGVLVDLIYMIFFNDIEIRIYGVGFYQFVKDEELRKE